MPHIDDLLNIQSHRPGYKHHWVYLDNGLPVMIVARYDIGKDKTYQQFRLQNDEWIEGMPPSPYPLYGLPSLKNPSLLDSLFVTEGEKCARVWCKRIGLGIFGFICLLLIAGMTYQFISSQIDKSKYPLPGQMIDIGGYQLHIQSMGLDGPTVVLDAGLGNIGYDWILIQPEIAKFARVVCCDRAGYGWSEKGPSPRSSAQIVKELHTLLHAAKIPGPYILVGHSFGGGNVQLFASTFPNEVSGIVLVDSCHEDQEERLPQNPLEDSFLSKPIVGRLTQFFGMNRMMMKLYANITPPPLPQSEWDTHMALCLTSKHWNTMLAESETFKESMAQLKNADRSTLAGIPCIVITAGTLPDLSAFGLDEHLHAYFQEMFIVWGDLQKEIVAKFKNGRQLIAEKSDHMIPFHQPELIVQAVRELIEENPKLLAGGTNRSFSFIPEPSFTGK